VETNRGLFGCFAGVSAYGARQFAIKEGSLMTKQWCALAHGSF
jgi:hypothetical protein